MNISEAGKRLYKKGFAPGLSGNISIRKHYGILITPSGFNLGDVEEKHLVEISNDLKILRGKEKPSSEKNLHIEIYKKRNDIGAIIHAHTPKATAFAASGIDLNKHIHSEAYFVLGDIKMADYAMPSSDKLAQVTAECFNDSNVVIMKNHGVVVGGKDLEDAYYKLETLELYAELCLWDKVLGGNSILSDTDLEDIAKLRV